MKSYEFNITVNGSNQIVKLDAGSIINALEKVHKKLQNEDDLDPQGYKITSMAQLYTLTPSSKNFIRSEYSVPGGPNPDVRKSIPIIEPNP